MEPADFEEEKKGNKIPALPLYKQNLKYRQAP